jgi:hypothetical protein
MSGVPGEDGLMLDELGRERLAEGRQHLVALLSEHDRMRQDIRKGSLPDDVLAPGMTVGVPEVRMRALSPECGSGGGGVSELREKPARWRAR